MATAEAEHDLLALATREKFFTDLYESAFPQVARFIRNRQGTLQDAKDIFQDALVIFYEKQLEKNLEVKVSDEAYVLGIVKHLWFKNYRQDRINVPLTTFETSITIPDDYFPTVSTEKLVQFLERAGKKCMDLLHAFYYNRNSINDIKNKFGYGSAHSATAQKFKCLQKIRDKVKEKSLGYDDFIE